jgi:hypothetical protein
MVLTLGDAGCAMAQVSTAHAIEDPRPGWHGLRRARVDEGSFRQSDRT